jgi:hypothetical protein
MLREVHEHIVSELQQSSRTDTVFIITAVLFNLVVLGVNWGVAAESRSDAPAGGNDWILALLVVATLMINVFALRALVAGRQTRQKLISGLVAMYKDNDVAKYYDASLIATYGARYKLFMAVLVSLALVSVVVPLIARVLG